MIQGVSKKIENIELNQSSTTRESNSMAESVSPKIDHISNLPVELIQNIAFRLDASSYQNFYITSKKLNNILPSFQHMLVSIRNDTCHNDLRKEFESVTYGNLNKCADDELLGIWLG